MPKGTVGIWLRVVAPCYICTKVGRGGMWAGQKICISSIVEGYQKTETTSVRKGELPICRV